MRSHGAAELTGAANQDARIRTGAH
jgi:hypothetical protein